MAATDYAVMLLFSVHQFFLWLPPCRRTIAVVNNGRFYINKIWTALRLLRAASHSASEMLWEFIKRNTYTHYPRKLDDALTLLWNVNKVANRLTNDVKFRIFINFIWKYYSILEKLRQQLKINLCEKTRFWIANENFTFQENVINYSSNSI